MCDDVIIGLWDPHSLPAVFLYGNSSSSTSSSHNGETFLRKAGAGAPVVADTNMVAVVDEVFVGADSIAQAIRNHTNTTVTITVTGNPSLNTYVYNYSY